MENTTAATITNANIYRAEGQWYYRADTPAGWDHNGELEAETEDEARAEIAALFPAAIISKVADIR